MYVYSRLDKQLCLWANCYTALLEGRIVAPRSSVRPSNSILPVPLMFSKHESCIKF